MKVLTLYTPAAPHKGSPSPDQMAKMGAYMAASFKSGLLSATGGIAPSATRGVRAKLSGGKFEVESGPLKSTLQQASGWAILNVESRDHLVTVLREFLEMAGDGESDAIEIFEPSHTGS
jgi:hypothetical protein